MVTKKDNSSGNALLETVVLIPVVLLFVFVAIDAGIYFTTKAALVDSLRTAAVSEVSKLRKTSLYQFLASGEVVLNSELETELESSLLKGLRSKLSRFISVDSEETSFELEVDLISLDIDTETGELRKEFSFIDEKNSFLLAQFENQNVPFEYALATVVFGETVYFPHVAFLFLKVSLDLSSLNQGVLPKRLGKQFRIEEKVLLPIRWMVV